MEQLLSGGEMHKCQEEKEKIPPCHKSYSVDFFFFFKASFKTVKAQEPLEDVIRIFEHGQTQEFSLKHHICKQHTQLSAKIMFKANKTNYKWLKLSKTYKQMREVVVMVTARQQRLHLINADNVHERAKRKTLGRL